MTFSRFMSQPVGRIIRAVLGLVLIALAFFVMGGTPGIVVAIIGIVVGLVGLVLIAAGVFDFCVLGPFVGGYFDGRKNRESVPPRTRGGAAQH
jgi:hypothetical protein